jgi:hypothetical protein
MFKQKIEEGREEGGGRSSKKKEISEKGEYWKFCPSMKT